MVRLFFFYISRTFVNSIRKLFRTWVVILVGCILLFSVACGFGASFLAEQADEGAENSSVEEEVDDISGEEYYEVDFDVGAVIEGLGITGTQLLEIVAGAIILVVWVFELIGSDKSSAAIFQMPDVHFLFAAPIHPQTVLLFRVVMQMGLSLVGSMYLLFQIPNLLGMGLSLGAIFVLFAGWVLLVIQGKLIAVFRYVFSSVHPAFRKGVYYGIAGFVLGLAAVFRFMMAAGHMGPGETAARLFAGEASRWVPVWGWLKGFIFYGAEGKTVPAALCLAGVLLSVAGFTWLVWRIRADFYEDALQVATDREEKIADAKEGRKAAKKHKVKERNYTFDRGWGADVFFHRSMYIRRHSPLFGLANGSTGLMWTVCVCYAVICLYFLGERDFTVLGVLLLGILFFKSYGNPVAQETEVNFIFLVPESPLKKLGAAWLAGVAGTALELFPMMAFSGVLLCRPWYMGGLWYVCLLAFDTLCSASGLFAEFVLPDFVNPVIKALLEFMVKGLAAGGIVILAAVVCVFVSVPVGLAAAVAVAAAVSFCLFLGALLGVGGRF
ncbi:MAG TPA: hypothetical protein DF613_03320 [Lachnospiraceae bacterium]|nr:hypothetical protein [Lachnospiraceae bacterium]